MMKETHKLLLIMILITLGMCISSGQKAYAATTYTWEKYETEIKKSNPRLGEWRDAGWKFVSGTASTSGYANYSITDDGITFDNESHVYFNGYWYGDYVYDRPNLNVGLDVKVEDIDRNDMNIMKVMCDLYDSTTAQAHYFFNKLIWDETYVKKESDGYPQTVTSSSNIYPANGRASDGYWYVLKSSTNNPTIEVTSPVTGTYGENISLQGSVNDADTGDIITTKYNIDGGQTQNVGTTTSTGVKKAFNTTTIDISGLSKGTHTLNVWAEDNKGGMSNVIKVSFQKEALYYYNKYTVEKHPLGNPDFNMSYSIETENGDWATLYTNTYIDEPIWDPGKGFVFPTDNPTPTPTANEEYKYYSVYNLGNTDYTTVKRKMKFEGTAVEGHWVVPIITTETWGMFLTDGRGSLVEANIQAFDGTYPDNGLQNGYWYVKGSVVDNNPTITIITPEAEEIYSGLSGGHNKINLTGIVTDANSGDIISTYYNIDGGSTKAVTGTVATNGNFTPTFIDVAGLEEEQHTLSAWCKDNTGKVSNVVQINFTIDNTAPIISIAGIEEGRTYQGAVTPSFTAEDLNGIDSVTGELNGQQFISGTEVTAEGTYVLELTASDMAGNTSSLTVTFAIDSTAPVISISGIEQGRTYRGAVTPLFAAEDLNGIAYVTGELNGQQFISGTEVTAEGIYTLKLTASDMAGNTSSLTVTFAIDKTAPVISVSGIEEGHSYKGTVTPLFTADDLFTADALNNIDSVTGTLNGQQFISGTEVKAEGAYALELTASDIAGNTSSLTITFAIDKTAPVISVSGIEEGHSYKGTVTPLFTADDLNGIDSFAGKLNGQQFISGTEVKAEGTYTLELTASDMAGNTSSLTVTFSIDKAAPVIKVSGIEQGRTYQGSVTPLFTAGDLNGVDSVTGTLNGQRFVSGTEVKAEGTYALKLTASDTAGNTSSLTITFAIDKTAPATDNAPKAAATGIQQISVNINIPYLIKKGAVFKLNEVVDSTGKLFFESSDDNIVSVSTKYNAIIGLNEGYAYIIARDLESNRIVAKVNLKVEDVFPKERGFSDIDASPVRDELVNGSAIKLVKEEDFRPEDEVTSTEFVVMLSRVILANDNNSLPFHRENKDFGFSDSDPLYPYAAYVITKTSTSSGTALFDSNDKTLTRGEMAKIILSISKGAFDKKVKNYSFDDLDLNLSGENTSAIEYCIETGILRGYGNSKIGGDDKLTRVQMILVLDRFADSMKSVGS